MPGYDSPVSASKRGRMIICLSLNSLQWSLLTVRHCHYFAFAFSVLSFLAIVNPIGYHGSGRDDDGGWAAS